MSLYDDLDAKAGSIRGISEDLAGWGSSLKVLETQKQLQATKKCILQTVKRKPEGTVLAPVIDLKGRKEMPSELRFNQITGKLEATTNVAAFIGGEAPMSFGVKDEYDPMKPNDYESYVKLRRDDKNKDKDDNRKSRHSDERESRRDRRRGSDEEDDDDYSRRRDRDRDVERDRDRDRERERERDRDRDRDRDRRDRDRDRSRDDDDGEFERRRRMREEDEEEDSRSHRLARNTGAAIAPPPSLMDLNIPPPEFLLKKQTSEKPEQAGPDPGTKFGMAGTVASKIMAKMGYREGQGLGKSEQGMSIALQVEKTSKRGGKIIHERDLAKMQEPMPVAVQPQVQQPQLQAPKPDMSNANLLRNPSKVICLRNMVGHGEVDEDLEGETAEECGKYGKVIKCLIFEIPDAPDEEAVRIFLEFERLESAIKAVVDLNGRYFGGRTVKANFYNLDKFRRFDLADIVE